MLILFIHLCKSWSCQTTTWLLLSNRWKDWSVRTFHLMATLLWAPIQSRSFDLPLLPLESDPMEQFVILLHVKRNVIHREAYLSLMVDWKSLFSCISHLLLVARLIITKFVLCQNVLLLSISLEQWCTLCELGEFVKLLIVLTFNQVADVLPCDLLILVINRRSENFILAVHLLYILLHFN